MTDVVHWLHLVAASVWTGGLIVLGALVVALRKAGARRELLQAAARQFGKVSWTAMGIAVLTGIGQVHGKGFAWTKGMLPWKLAVVGLAIALAAYHQFTARKASPAARGIIQLLILLVSLGIFAVAVKL